MINLALIGLGYWGKRMVNSAEASGRFKVSQAVVTNLTNETTQEFAKAQNIALTTSIDDVLNDPDINAVALATPYKLHTAQIKSAAAAGKHVYSEKPFAFTKDEAEQAVAACQKSRVVLALGHDQRFYPTIMEIKQLIDEKKLGTLLHIEANLSHDAFQMVYQARNNPSALSPADKNRYAAGRQPAAWRLDPKEAPMGPLVHFGIHRIDSFIHLFGEVDWVFAACADSTLDPEVIDTLAVTLKFKCGAIGQLSCSMSTPLNSRLQVFGSDGWAEARGAEDPKEYSQTSLKYLIHVHGGERQESAYEPVDSVEKNFEAFADAIGGKTAFLITPEQMIHNAAILEAIEESIETNTPSKVS